MRCAPFALMLALLTVLDSYSFVVSVNSKTILEICSGGIG